MAILFSTCKDEIFLGDIDVESSEINTVYFDINNLMDGPISTLGATPHKLGPERKNPFTVEVMEQARIAVYGGKPPAVTKATSAPAPAPTSDRYIKFTPRTVEHLAILEESDLFLLDFPMTRELFEYGDYYEAVTGTTDYPDLYTTVAVGVTLPDVPYTVISNLNLVESDPLVIQKAFELTGNEAEFREAYGENPTMENLDFSNECDYDPNTVILPPDCGDGGGGGGGTSTLIPNECGCQIFRNQRKPGGTVKVEDTQFRDFLPLRRVEVIAKDSWFTLRRVNTDDLGCWRIDREFSGKGWFWIRFKDKVSNRGKLRVAGADTWRLWQKARTASTFLGIMRGPTFHNILTRFGRWDGNNAGTITHYGWAAATVNNALHEFHDFAQREGFVRPPSRLNIMVGLKRRNGFATMLRQMGSTNFITAVNQGVGFWAPNVAGFSINDDLGYYLLLATRTSTWPASSPLLNTFMGDVNTGGEFKESDAMKRVAYHELGHASHYAGSSVAFYSGVIAAEVGAFGHGNPSSNLAGHIQVAESWAEHIALTMIKQSYPSTLTTTTHNIGTSWANRHERVRNESNRHVPVGVYFDLADGLSARELVIDENGGNSGTLIDNVRGGYTNAFFARNLNSTVRSPSDLRNLCLANLPSGVSQTNVNELFNQY
ncbi:hypothetical protein [Lewinella sp. IMCC34183]|uniref:hypothetical protein n=1 Tax=Lewinella sp. IMCC34183 TaxID=2248762 RepID=UPI0018E52647|nr:hypothetical protein [Lewinella sp. IMCC34183]